MVCPNCGNSFTVLGKQCPYCRQDLSIQNVNKHNKGKVKLDSDSSNNIYLYLGAFIPFYGLIYYIKNCSDYPIKSYNAIKGFKYNCVMIILIAIVLFFALS